MQKKIFLLCAMLIATIGFSSFASAECINMPALMGYISNWKSGSLEMPELMAYISQWKTGAGCGTGAITASIVASRTSCVAPCTVSFDGTATIASSTARPFHDLDYTWNFGDSASGTWAVSGKSKNTAKGPVAAHVFDNAGTYNVNLNVKDTSGNTATKQVQITVQNPDTVFASNAVCFAKDNLNWNGCPSGATQQVVTGDIAAAMQTAIDSGKRRLLLRRGDSWGTGSTVWINVSGPGIIGAFGTCISPNARNICENAPIITQTSPSASLISFPGQYNPANNHKRDWRIMDLHLKGSVDDASENNSQGIIGSGDFSEELMYRLKVEGFYFGINSTKYLGEIGDKELGYNHKFAVIDSEVTNNWNYSIYAGSTQIAIMGNKLQYVQSGHILRVWEGYKGVISNNTLEDVCLNPNNIFGCHVLKLVGPVEAEIGPNLPRTEFMVISDNKFGSGRGAWAVGIGPMDHLVDERLSNIIIENNRFNMKTIATQSVAQVDLLIWARNITVRNNVFDLTGAELFHKAIFVGQRGIEPAPENISILNNTAYSADSSNFIFLEISPEASNTIVKNNIASAPFVSSPELIRGTGTNLTQSNNLLTSTPGFVNPSTGDFHITSSSPAKDAGTNILVFEDFDNRIRPQGTAFDLGAYEYSS